MGTGSLSISATTASVLAGAAGGFVGGLVASGGDLRAGITGAFVAGSAGFIGASSAFSNLGELTIAHGVVGGVASKANGGSFKSGFISSAFTKSVSGRIAALTENYPIAGGIAASAVGGTASELSGGKFTNGARTMAFMHLFREAPGFYKRTVGYDLNAGPGGASVEKGPLGTPVSAANNIGTQDTWRFDSNGQ